jgi:hypothetical protein
MRCAALVVVLLCLLGCGSDSDERVARETPQPNAESTRPPDEVVESAGPLCEAAQQIRDLDDATSARFNEAMLTAGEQGFEEADAAFMGVLADMEALLPEMTDAYDLLAASVPHDMVADVEMARDLTVNLAEAMSRMESVTEIDLMLDGFDEQEIIEGTQAVLRLDRPTRDECGITIAG